MEAASERLQRPRDHFKEDHSINGLPSIRLLRRGLAITVVGKITPPTEPYQFWRRTDVRTCARIHREVGLPR